MFDDIYWMFLHERYFGHQESIGEQVGLLTVDERDELEGFVQMKMQQLEAEEKTLDEHLTFDEVFKL